MKVFRSARVALLATGLAAVVTVATGYAASSATQSPVAASGSPIVVGNIGSYSGAEADTEGAAEVTIQAWAKSVNANGGIKGHPVKLIVMDDALNPTTALTDVNKLIQQDHVVAIVSDMSDVDTVWASVAEKAGVPVIGGLSVDVPFETNPDFFATGTTNVALNYGMEREAAFNGPKLAFVYCAEAPVCAQAVPLEKGLAKAAGVQVVYSAAVSASAPNYTAQCLGIKNSGAQSYASVLTGTVAQRFAAACASQGVTAKVVSQDGSNINSWAQTPALNGERSAELVFPWFDHSIPATQAYQAALARYAPTLGDGNDSTAAYTWASGMLFEKAVEASGAKTVTPASIKAGLYSLKGVTLGGLTVPLTFVKGKPNLVNCYFTVGIEGGKYVEPDKLKTNCAPDSVVNAEGAKLGLNKS